MSASEAKSANSFRNSVLKKASLKLKNLNPKKKYKPKGVLVDVSIKKKEVFMPFLVC